MSAIISMKNIGKKFDDNYVIKNISFSINKGEMVAITGASGSGKSTLLNILGLISNPSEGELSLFGQKINTMNSQRAMLLRRNNIGYLFQNYGLVDEETVEWNLKLAYAYKKTGRKQQEKEIDELLNDFNMKDMKKKKIYQLSGGEQQRIAIIRLIIKDSDLILADEPTGSLDVENRNLVVKCLKELNNQGKTIVIVTHDLDIANACPKKITIPNVI